MAPAEERVRLFVALELPEQVRTPLAHWQAQAVARLPEWRAVRAESLHVTLCFLGWRAAGEVGEIAAACSAIEGRSAPELTLAEAIALPPRRPRVLAVALGDPSGALATVQRELSRGLADGGWYEPERRPFLPHVTVARLRGAPPRRMPGLSPPPSACFLASRVVLYRSRPGPGGARYAPQATVRLASSG